MKKHLIYLCMASLLGMTACEDDFNKENFKGLDEMTAPQNVLDKDYTLTEADYITIAGLTVPYYNGSGELDTIDKAIMTAVKTDQYLTSASDPRVVLPVFLAKNWKTASLDATLRLTFNYVQDVPVYLTDLAATQTYELTADDYKTIWGEAGNDYLNSEKSPKENLPVILEKAIAEPTEGEYVIATYQYLDESRADNEQDEEIVELLNESFAEGQGDFIINDVLLPSGSTYVWSADKSNGYMKASAYVNKTNLPSESWLISPVVDMSEVNKAILTFEHVARFGLTDHSDLTLWVSTDYEDGLPSTANWTAVSIPNYSSGTDWTFVASGEILLNDFVGNSNVHFAFKYTSTAEKSATWEVKNVAVTGSIVANEFETRNAVYAYDGETWAEAEKILILNSTDYKTMGAPEKGYFSTEISADNYLPRFLNSKYPYAQESDTLFVIYNYSNKTTLKADEYVFADGVWKCTTQPVTAVTEQYALAVDGWVYSPDVVVTLKPGRNAEETYFQKLTDWVWENVDQNKEEGLGLTEEEKGKGYVTSYGNNDYYYGGSQYQNNFDFRPSAWRTQNENAYGEMSDEELTELMWKRLPEGIEHMLDTMYPDMVQTDEPISYVLKFGIYGIDGSSATKYYSIRCRLVGKGKFSYVEGSLKEISGL